MGRDSAIAHPGCFLAIDDVAVAVFNRPDLGGKLLVTHLLIAAQDPVSAMVWLNDRPAANELATGIVDIAFRPASHFRIVQHGRIGEGSPATLRLIARPASP